MNRFALKVGRLVPIQVSQAVPATASVRAAVWRASARDTHMLLRILVPTLLLSLSLGAAQAGETTWERNAR